MELKIWTSCLLLLTLAHAQRGLVRHFDWRMVDSIPDVPKINPFFSAQPTESYPVVDYPKAIEYPKEVDYPQDDVYAPQPMRYKDYSGPHSANKGPLYDHVSEHEQVPPGSSYKYMDEPADSPYQYQILKAGSPYQYMPAGSPYQYQDEPAGSPHKYPDQLSGYQYQSVAPYQTYRPKEPMNLTAARVGGFAGSGDAKGFGAYDIPKAHQSVDEDADADENEDDEHLKIAPRRQRLRLQYPGEDVLDPEVIRRIPIPHPV